MKLNLENKLKHQTLLNSWGVKFLKFCSRDFIFLAIFLREYKMLFQIPALQHYGFTAVVMTAVYFFIASVEDLKIFFAMGGQISATNLMIVFPSCFFIFICHKDRK